MKEDYYLYEYIKIFFELEKKRKNIISINV